MGKFLKSVFHKKKHYSKIGTVFGLSLSTLQCRRQNPSQLPTEVRLFHGQDDAQFFGKQQLVLKMT